MNIRITEKELQAWLDKTGDDELIEIEAGEYDEKWLDDAFDVRNFTIVRREHMLFMDCSADGALFLAELERHTVYWKEHGSDYFYKSIPEWQAETGLTVHAIRASIDKLKKLGVLETWIKKANGVPMNHFRYDSRKARYLMKMNHAKRLKQAAIEMVEKRRADGPCENARTAARADGPCENARSTMRKRKDQGQCENARTINISKGNTNKEKENNMSEPNGSDSARSEKSEVSSLADGKATKKQPSPFDIKARDEFYKVVQTYCKLNCKTDTKKDALIIRKMREIDGVPEEVIKARIKWYKKFIGRKYCPVALSVSAFREKGDKFVSAMLRSETDDLTGNLNGNGHAKLDKEGDEIVKRVLERRAQRIKT